MTLTELTDLCAAGIPVAVEIHALTPMVYVVYVCDGEHREPLRDAGGSLKFTSRYAAQAALAETGLPSATFLHASAYDEMIGLDGAAAATAFRETVLLRRD